MRTIKDVELFLEQFFDREYELHINRNKLLGTRGEYIKSVSDFFKDNVYVTAKSNFSSLNVWPKRKDESKRLRFIDEILRRRKVFVIEHYNGVKLDSTIENGGVDSYLFLCYVSDCNEITNNDYFERFYVAVFGDDLKLVAVDSMTHDEGWKEIAEFPSIVKLGERTKVEKYDAPVDEKDLEHYNSL